jgi:hypothetical protein
MSDCSCKSKVFRPKGTVHRVNVLGANSTGAVCATSSGYTRGRRLLAEASNAKVHYPGNMLSSPLTGVTNCDLDFSVVDYSSLDISLRRKCSCV